MECKELINLIKEVKEKKQKQLEQKKHNINNDYQLAKLDFIVIDNLKDNITTLDKIIAELEGLQERIIRSKKKVIKNKKGKHKKKYNYKNIIMLLLFIITSIILLHDVYMITTKFASYTMFGFVTSIISIYINITSFLYIDDELKKIK